MRVFLFLGGKDVHIVHTVLRQNNDNKLQILNLILTFLIMLKIKNVKKLQIKKIENTN